MKIKIYTVDLEIPRRTKRLILAIGIPVLALLGAGTIVWASVPNMFNAGDTLSATKMNDNFSALDTRLTTLEGKPSPHLPNGAADPGTCDAAHVGQVYFNTSSNQLLLCTSGRWSAMITNAACTDTTQQSMRHFGTGNCTPHLGDQSWLSSKVYPTSGDFGFHDSGCNSPVYPAYAAIDLGSARAVTRLRIQLHSNPMKGAVFQGSNDSTNGNDGTWATLGSPFDMPSGMELQWWESPAFTNVKPYRFYRLYATSGPGFAFYRWAMFEC